ncbi:MAG: hypothetical protein AAFZ15_19180 [Bacteroidota bacterium]
MPKLNCKDVSDISVDADTSVAGIPLVKGLDPRGLVCNLAFLVSDSIENTCGGNFIIKRKWQAFDFCTDEFFTHTQVIVVADEEGPEFTVPDTMLISTDNNCSDVVRLPPINLIQECSPFSIFIETPWNTFSMDSVIAAVDRTPGNYNAIYTATDECGNESKDSIILHVTDGETAICLEEKNITADFYLSNFQSALDTGNYSVLNIYGEPTFFENCTNTPVVDVQLNLDACYEGFILRQHSINFSGDIIQCEQIINVHHVSDFVVEFPNDLNFYCDGNPADFGEPEIFFETCELIAVSFEDEIFNDVADACFKINRQWAVINWCVVGDELDQEVVENSEEEFINSNCDLLDDCDFNTDFMCNNRTFRDSWSICNLPDFSVATNSQGPDSDPDSDPWDGYITYLQVIKVVDEIDPVFIDGCNLPDVCLDSNNCITNLMLPIPGVQECGLDPSFHISVRVGSVWEDVVGPLNIGPGEHLVRFVAVDNCNNQTACETEVKVEDCTPPSLICESQLQVPLLNTGQVSQVILFAEDLMESSSDNCDNNVKISFSPTLSDVLRTYTCDDVGINLINVWGTDNYGNQSSCVAEINIVETINTDCNVTGPGTGGNVDNEFGNGIQNVEIKNSFNFPTQTNEFGSYFLSNALQTVPFYLLPYKNIEPNNGVTTFDIVLLVKHILGVELLDSPYKIIAADINRSNTVTTFDAVEMRKLILGINTEFPNNTSWRFVHKDIVFDDPSNPFAQPIPDTFWVNNVNILSVDFTGMKIGDLNGSASLDFTGNTDERSAQEILFLKTQDIIFEKDELIEIPFYFNQKDIIGFQGEFKFDMEMLQIMEVKNGILTNEHFGKNKLDDGVLKFSYNQIERIISDKNNLIFTIVFRSLSRGNLKDALFMDSAEIVAEAYTKSMSIHPLELSFNKVEDATDQYFEVLSAQPNPFRDKTVISFRLPYDCEVSFSFISVDGKLLRSLNSTFTKGDSSIEIRKSDLGQSGIVFCKMETAYGTELTRLVLID